MFATGHATGNEAVSAKRAAVLTRDHFIGMTISGEMRLFEITRASSPIDCCRAALRQAPNCCAAMARMTALRLLSARRPFRLTRQGRSGQVETTASRKATHFSHCMRRFGARRKNLTRSPANPSTP